MNFLKKHYEKVLLFGLFLIFALLLIHLYSIVQSTGEVKDSDLQIPVRDPDYKIADVKAVEFNLPVLFELNTNWMKPGSRSAVPGKDFSDIMGIFKIARCGHCKYLIPRRVMEASEKCLRPECGKALLPPKKEETGSVGAAELDTDEDGIPNIIELVYGLNPYDASDAMHDLDDDGFINVYEYIMLKNTDEFKQLLSSETKNISSDETKKLALNNPRVHPPLYLGLYVEKIDRQPINAELLGVSVIQGMNKSFWDVQLQINEHKSKKKRRLTKPGKGYYSIGKKIVLDTGSYTIHDIIKDEKAAAASAKEEKDAKAKQADDSRKLQKDYYIVLKDNKNRDVIMRVGEVTYDLDDQAFFKDVWGLRPQYDGQVNQYIRMGNSKIGYTRYRIKAIDKRTNSVTFHSPEKGGKDIVVKRKALIPEEFIPSKEKAKEEEDERSGMPGDASTPGRR